MKYSFIYFVLFILLTFISSTIFAQGNSQVALFNGKDLTGWNSYIGAPLDDAGKKLSEIPVGLNNDPNHVFSIVQQDGEKVIRISGENWGCIYTLKEYSDFQLQLQFKWGTLSWGQKKGKKKDSGVLYFSVGDNGADYGAWMRSQEFQVEEGNCGDYWGVAGGMEDVPVIKSAVGRHCIKNGDAENATGEWNTLDLYCHGDTSVQMVNGKVVMVLYNSRQWENGQAIPLVKGKIQIQSEGAEIFYKHITIEPLNQIPEAFLK